LRRKGDELATAIRNLARALADVTTFVRATATGSQNVAALADLTGVWSNSSGR
jgi:hypothetical protein